MKKIALFSFAVVALSLASCKKDRTCECTTTTVNTNGNGSASTSSVTIKKIKKSEAKTLCQKIVSAHTNNGGQTSTTTDDCKLK